MPASFQGITSDLSMGHMETSSLPGRRSSGLAMSTFYAASETGSAATEDTAMGSGESHSQRSKGNIASIGWLHVRAEPSHGCLLPLECLWEVQAA